MSRWSVSKTFHQVTAEDFKAAVKMVQNTMAKSCATPMAATITAYTGIPHSCTSWDDMTVAYLQEQRLKLIFKEVSSPDALTDADWAKAAYIEAVIRPVDEGMAPPYTFSHIEAKGLHPRQMCLYVQPDNAGTHTLETSRNDTHKFWRKGDGMNSNQSVSYG